MCMENFHTICYFNFGPLGSVSLFCSKEIHSCQQYSSNNWRHSTSANPFFKPGFNIVYYHSNSLNWSALPPWDKKPWVLIGSTMDAERGSLPSLLLMWCRWHSAVGTEAKWRWCWQPRHSRWLISSLEARHVVCTSAVSAWHHGVTVWSMGHLWPGLLIYTMTQSWLCQC